MTRHTWLALALAATATLVAFTSAFAKEIVSITIAGPGLGGTVEVTDSGDRDALGDIGGGGTGISPDRLPELGEDFYTIRLSFGDEAGKVLATNVYHYYPDPQSGRGYIYFAAMEGGESDHVGTWFLASASWDDSFRGVLSGHGVALAPSATGADIATVGSPPLAGLQPAAGWILAAAAAVVISVLSFLRLRAGFPSK